jgi:hypothetical protein
MNLQETPAPATSPARSLLISNPPSSSRLYTADISYFDPENTNITGKIVIYTDVFAFTDILLYLAETQYNDIRTAFPFCLRGTALFWYLTELIPLERRLLLSALVSELYTSLISRFKERPGIALYTLISSRFTFHDIRSIRLSVRLFFWF